MTADPIIFAVAGQEYSFKEILAFAEFRADSARIRQELRDAIACLCYAEEEGFDLDVDRLQFLMDRFRYEHNLLSAEEFENWLKSCHLDLSQFIDYMTRGLWRERFSDKLQQFRGDYAPDESTLQSRLWEHVVLSGQLPRFALPLARRLAVERAYQNPNVSEHEVEAVQGAFFKRSGLAPCDLDPWLIGLGRARNWFTRVCRLEAIFKCFCRKSITDARCTRELYAHHLPLTRVTAQFAVFDSFDAAREAFLCITEDGEPFTRVLRRSGADIRTLSRRIKELPDDIAEKLLSGPLNSTLTPLQYGDGFAIFRVTDKREPDLSDPAVRRYIESQVLQSVLEDCTKSHIRWECPLFDPHES
jgi:hypothetical protein